MTTPLREDDRDLLTLRSYLLGRLDDEERGRVEDRLFPSGMPTDEDERWSELLQVAEDELIEDYLSGEMSFEERHALALSFSWTKVRRDKLRVAARLAALAEGGPAAAAGSITSSGRSLPAWAPAAAALLVALTGLVGFQLGRSPGIAEPLPVHLSSNPVDRGVGGMTRVVPTPLLTRLSLEIGIDEFESYRAELYRLDAVDYRRIRLYGSLPPVSSETTAAVELDVPSDVLESGSYYVSLFGEAKEGEPRFVARFDFEVD